MTRLMLLLVVISTASANTCLSSASGNWNDASRWTSCGGTVPGNSDTVTIAAGHTVTVPVGYQAIAGVSGLGGPQQTDTGGVVPAIHCASENGNGILVINGTLTFRGNVEQCTAVWTAGPDATIEHDSSLAASPSTTHYRWIIGTYLWPDPAKLVIRGTPGHRATIRNAASSGTFYGFTSNKYSNQGSGQFDFEYVTVDGCGGASACVNSSSHKSTTASIGRCDHCLVTNSGTFAANASGDGTRGPLNVISITNSSFTLPTDPNSYAISIPPSGSGSITIDSIFTTGVIYLPGVAGTYASGTHIRNVIANTLSNNYPIKLGGSYFRVAEFDLVLRVTDKLTGGNTGTPAYLPGGALTRIMCLINSNSNPHCFSGPNGDGISNDSVNGGYVEKIGTGIDGDLFLGGAIGATTRTLSNVVSACSTTDGKSIGTFSNVTGPSSGNVVMLQNTICGNDGGAGTGMGASLETWAGAAGLFSAVKNNITYAATPSAVYLVKQGPSLGGPANVTAGTYNGVDYNWKWNVTTGPYYGIAAAYTSPAPPGTHDSSGDPQFLQQRHFLDWGQMLKPEITSWTDIVAELAKMNNDTGFDSRFTILNAYNWLRAGYAPQNLALMTAGDTGGRVGAMDYVAPPAGGTVRRRLVQ